MKNSKRILLLSVLLVAVLCGMSMLLATGKNGDVEYDIVFFGDSIVAGEHSERDLPAMLAEETGYKVLNAGYGGLTMSRLRKEKYVGDSDDFYSMVGLSEAVLKRDFSFQLVASQKDNVAVLDYWYETANQLANTDWDKVNYILIEQGANDYLNGIKLDNPEDKYDKSTYGGALRAVIENISKGAPNAQIVIMTPIYMDPDRLPGDCYEVDYGGGYLADYVNKEKEIASEYGVFLIDNFTELDFNRQNKDELLPGGLHPSTEGKVMIIENIVKHMKELDGFNTETD